MFTGIIEQMATVVSNTRGQLALKAHQEAPIVGESVSINGTCLTTVSKKRAVFDVELGMETLTRTNLGLLQPGDGVNLEKSLTLQTPLGGHFVTGHVDECVLILKKDSLRGGFAWIRFEMPRHLKPFIALKGSVAIDGVSLTVAKVGTFYFEVMLIPYTLKVTTLGTKKAKDLVNIEIDIVARYVRNMLETK